MKISLINLEDSCESEEIIEVEKDYEPLKNDSVDISETSIEIIDSKEISVDEVKNIVNDLLNNITESRAADEISDHHSVQSNIQENHHSVESNIQENHHPVKSNIQENHDSVQSNIKKNHPSVQANIQKKDSKINQKRKISQAVATSFANDDIIYEKNSTLNLTSNSTVRQKITGPQSSSNSTNDTTVNTSKTVTKSSTKKRNKKRSNNSSRTTYEPIASTSQAREINNIQQVSLLESANNKYFMVSSSTKKILSLSNRNSINFKKFTTLEKSDSLLIGIVEEKYPDVTPMRDDHLIVLKRLINYQIDQLSRDRFIPRFLDSYIKNGAIIVKCYDTRSREWLQMIVPKLLDDRSIKLKTSSIRDLFRLYKCNICVPHEKDAITALRRIQKQNQEINVSKWRLYSQQVLRGDTYSVSLNIGIPDYCMDLLKMKNFKIFHGMERIKINIADDYEF